ncbi:protein of unknown function [Tenacibaculum sp. 190524A02b]|uniref:Uncharacterized protein n=1 Tax=Tenacibaculum vairaonense TaxID=3137860 RepID=A0ABM9PI57_9FLAO
MSMFMNSVRKTLKFNGIRLNTLMICYNPRRLVSILGIETLKSRLKELYIVFYEEVNGFLAFCTLFFHFGSDTIKKNIVFKLTLLVYI